MVFMLILVPFFIFLIGFLIEKNKKQNVRMALVSSKWEKKQDNLKYKAAKHRFEEFTSHGIYYCNVCRKLVGGICRPACLECQICGQIVHKLCKYKIRSLCKQVCLAGEKTQYKHQWVEGNISLHSICAKCDLKCFTNYDLGGWSCLWCQRVVHDECKDTINKVCDFGLLARHIISPEEIIYLSEKDKNLQSEGSDQEDVIATITPKDKGIVKFTSKLFLQVLESQKDLGFKFTIHETKEPLLIVINKTSGGQSGANYLKQFNRYLNPIQVINLIDDGLDRLKIFSRVKNLKILVAGGDGTIGSTLNYIRSGQIPEWKDRHPPLAILPLGTGNDLSRALGWGSGADNGDAMNIIKQVGQVDNIVHLDRWLIQIKKQKSITNTRLGNIFKDNIFKKHEFSKDQDFIMYNYFSIGLDAKFCLDFHKLRKSNPQFFKSRLGNKFIYTHMGLSDLVMGRKPALWKFIKIFCNQKEVEIPENIENIVILNINSWAGGISNLWSQNEDNLSPLLSQDNDNDKKHNSQSQYKPQRLGDGVFEVIGITSILHLGRIQVGIDVPLKICQGSELSLVIDAPSTQFIQIDGEPQQITTPIQINIKLIERVHMFSKLPTTMINWESKLIKTMNWAEENNLINQEAKQQILHRMLS